MLAKICCTATVLVLLAVVGTEAARLRLGSPGYCNGLNCPRYNVLKNCSGFEIRQYARAQWVGSNYQGPGYSDWELSTGQGFQHGFSYISGANAKHEKIEMTAPVLNKVVAGAGPNCNTSFTVSFYVPYAFQGKAPQPTNPQTFLHYSPDALTVAVGVFGGYFQSFQTDVAPPLKKLGEDLQKANIKFDQGTFWVAGYDSPFRIFDRHNEVWFQVPADSQC